MAFRMHLWSVDGPRLTEIGSGSLDVEDRLENWLADDPSLLGIDLLVIGRQVHTDFGGRIDLLGLDADGNTYVLELKRARTPRDVVAQVLDYASWVKDLTYAELDAICTKHTGHPLGEAFGKHFGVSLPETVNDEHSLVIVASELDDASERIVQYLADDRGLAINAVFFQYFRDGERELLGRAWLRDPEEIQERTESKKRAPWSGYWFVNVGEGPHRNWDDCREYGFVAAGGGEKYSRPLQKLAEGDPVFAYMKGLGYVGFGKVRGEAKPVDEFTVGNDSTPVTELPLRAPDFMEHVVDPARTEWFVPVEWVKTFGRDEARWFVGGFANQNIVCKLRHPETVQFLEREFGVEADESS